MRIPRSSFCLALLAGCLPFHDAPDPEPYATVAEIPATVNRSVDLLFVIDDSAAMADEQLRLANAMPGFIDALRELEGGLPDLHVGVVSTDLGTSSSLDAPAPAIGVLSNGGCASTGKHGALTVNGASVDGTWLRDV